MIVCGPRVGQRRCTACKKWFAAAIMRECDWKIGRAAETEVQKTCDALICVHCASHPAPDKDLCPQHTEAWQRLQKARGITCEEA